MAIYSSSSTHFDDFPVAGQCDVTKGLSLQQGREDTSQVAWVVVPAQTILLVHIALVSGYDSVMGKRKSIRKCHKLRGGKEKCEFHETKVLPIFFNKTKYLFLLTHVDFLPLIFLTTY